MTTTTVLKRNNILNILNMFKYGESIAKPEIVKETGLTGTTVHYLIDELVAKGVIVDNGFTISSGGRKPCLYALNPQHGFILGVSIRLKSITIALFSMTMNIGSKDIITLDLPQQSISQTLDVIFSTIDGLLYDKNLKKKIIGIGINVPGPVDTENGIITKLAGAEKWVNVPLKKLFQERYGLQTIVDKDTCSGVLFVKNHTRNTSNNIVFLSTRDGLGTAIMINGSVYRGSHFIAGEIGHNTVSVSGHKCICGNTGCLELFISDPGLENNMSKVVTLIEKEKVLIEAMTYMRDAIGSLIRSYDPDEIVIDSDWVTSNRKLFFELLETLYEEDRLIDRNYVKISINETDDLLIKSAAMLILESEFTSVETSHFLN